ncbi:MAG: hypothetical protein IV100_25975 [Myxococcales bacterium]|nr:hypothetical protein [Myxococcales bacterium]
MQFEVEWEDAPGVRDRVLAATWGRLSLKVDGSYVTEVLDLRSSSRRTGIYGSLFPLAEWIVDSWWNLLHEPCPTTPVVSARAAKSWMRPFLQRHGLLSARDGGALPDLSIWNDGAETILHWDPDPPPISETRIRFVGQGHVRLPASAVQAGLTSLVNQVLGRLDALGLGEDEDTVRVRAAWAAVGDSTSDEPETCRRLALLGLNPYDPDDATEEIVALVGRAGAFLPPLLADDLLTGTRPSELVADLAWVEAGARDFGTHELPRLVRVGRTAHEAGYSAAREARRLLGLDTRSPVRDLPSVLVAGLGWSEEVERERARGASTRLDALVGWSAATQKPLSLVASRRSDTATRFRLARAAYVILASAVTAAPRLLTAAATHSQRESRAFAAELLVPAAALEERVRGAVSESQVEEIAEEFRVSPLLVKHQIENHRIGTIEA